MTGKTTWLADSSWQSFFFAYCLRSSESYNNFRWLLRGHSCTAVAGDMSCVQLQSLTKSQKKQKCGGCIEGGEETASMMCFAFCYTSGVREKDEA